MGIKKKEAAHPLHVCVVLNFRQTRQGSYPRGSVLSDGGFGRDDWLHSCFWPIDC